MKTFGETFREILRRQNLTQVDAARLLEISQSVVSRYCSLEEPPRPRILGWMSARLGVTVEELRGEAKPTKPKVLKAPEVESEEAITSGIRDLKRRWRKKPHERDTIKHLVAALFPKDAQRILAWLDES